MLKINQTFCFRGDNFIAQRLEEERDRLKEDLDKCTQMRDQMVVQVSSLKNGWF